MVKNCAALFLALGLLVGTVGSAANLPIPAQEFIAKNLLKNPGFENGKYGWTASGGATAAANTTAVLNGSYGYDWDSNSSSQTLTSDAITIPAGLKGRNGVVSCLIKVPSGTATHTLSAWDGSTALASATITSSAVPAVTTLNVPMPTSGTMALRLTSVASNEPEIYVDDCFMGAAEGFNLASISQAQLYGGAVVSGCAGSWSTTSTSLADLSTQTGCSYATFGNASAPSTMIAGIKFASLPPGEYVVEYEGLTSQTTSAKSSIFKFWDGTNYAREQSNLYSGSGGQTQIPGFKSTFSYSTTQSNITLSVRAAVTSGGTFAVYGTTNDWGVFRVYRFPSSTEQAVRPDQTPASWSGYHGSDCSWARTNTAYGDFASDASCTFTTRYNRNFGTVASYLNGSDPYPGIVFTPPAVGRYLACARWNMYGTAGAGISGRLYDGTNVIGESDFTASTSAYRVPHHLCGIVDAASRSAITLRIEGKASTGSVTIGVETATSAVDWSLVALDMPLPAPLLVGSVTSNSTGVERVERVKITGSGGSTCTVNSQSGSWVSGCTSAAAGNYTINFVAGIFASTPICTASALGAERATPIISLSTSAMNVYHENYSASLSDGSVQVICMGAR